MDIFRKRTQDENQMKNEKLIQSLTVDADINVRDIGYRLKNYAKDSDTSVIKPFDLMVDCVEMMISNHTDFKSEDYEDALNYGEKVYKEVFVFDDETDDFETLRNIFIEFFDERGVISQRSFNQTLFELFYDKMNYLKWAKSVSYIKNLSSYELYYIPYAAVARSYFADEDRFTANVISFTYRISGATDPKLFYEQQVEKVEHMAGIYNVDEARIMKAEHKLDVSESLLEKSEDVLKKAEERISLMDDLTKEALSKVKNQCDEKVSGAKIELGSLKQDLERKLDEFTQSQKNVILFEREELVKGVFAEAQQKLDELRQMSQVIVHSANLELSRINQESGSVMSKFDTYIKEDDQVKKLLADADNNKALMEKIDKLMLLNDQNITMIASQASGAKPIVQMPQSQADTVSVNISGVSNIATPLEQGEDDYISSVNVYLDESIHFKERYKTIMEEKHKRMDQGEHFHAMFDDVLTALLENANPYLIGPTGCGKTYLVGQIASLLEMDFIDIGYINEEYDILGFQTANGGYSRPNFYRCYKYGKIAFCDELDNGNSRATVKLNSFLSNTKNASYSFPNGENVKRHPNFRLIAAGNTAGNGADSNYNTREKIEESVQQRLMPIYVGYDNSVEKMILKDYASWYKFVEVFRAATDDWGKNNYGDAPGIITTRDVAKIKKYLDNGSFTDEKILDYEFIQTKDNSYLAFLSSYMSKHVTQGIAKQYVDLFAQRVESKRKK